MNTRQVLLPLLAYALLPSCGGGSPTPAIQSPPPSSQPPPAALKGGFWAGVLTFENDQTSEIFVGLLTEDGRFRFLSAESFTHFVGTQQVDAGHAVGSGLGYSDTGASWLDGSSVVPLSTDATLVERDNFTGIWSTSSGESGNFELFYDAEYERPSSLPLLEGVWTAYDENGNPDATFSIDDAGQFNGQNASGCTSVGSISIIDARYNLFDVNSTIANCSIAGDYSGLAALGDLVASNDAMILTVGNTTRGIVLGLQR